METRKVKSSDCNDALETLAAARSRLRRYLDRGISTADGADIMSAIDAALADLRAAPPSKQNAAPQQTPHCPPTPALRAAAAGLVTAAEMLEHNDAIFQGKWKKGSKAWSGDFILRTIADAVRQAQDGGDGSYPDVQGYGGNDQ